ncbi:MAG TPA: hypothetical protein VIB47_06295, partial [Dehalococcoidia bacterium]
MRALLRTPESRDALGAGLKGLGWEVAEAGGAEGCDLVAVNLPPYEAGDAVDVEGVATLRAAAAKHESVIVLCDPSDYEPVLAELKGG